MIMVFSSLDQDRIDLLEELELINSESLKMFDDITALAAHVCEVPIALITFLTKDEQFFKSRFGLDVISTPIEQSFCYHSTKTPDQLFEVEDAKNDERFKNNALVCGVPNIVSYYGAPLKTKSGVVLGALCVIDSKKNVLSEDKKNVLKNLASQVEHLIEFIDTSKKLKVHKTKLEKHNRDMEDFLAIAIHDLKSPLRGINSFTSLLKKKYLLKDDDKGEKYFSFIEKSISTMTQLIGNIIEYTKITKIEVEKEAFSVKNLVLDIFEDLTFNLEKKPILICTNLPEIKSSKTAFTILFSNLLSNAIKYKNKTSDTVIEITHTHADKYWIFSIKDNGIGIEEKFFEEIFKPFKRLHSSSEYEGSGLGLSNCNNIIDKLGGTMTVESIPNKETTFTIKIPMQ